MDLPDIKTLAAQVREDSKAYGSMVISLDDAGQFATRVLRCLFPPLSGIERAIDLDQELHNCAEVLRFLLVHLEATDPDSLVKKFFPGLPTVYQTLKEDAQAIADSDPAAQTLLEVITTYPGFLAAGYYRIAHLLSQLSAPVLPRMITEYAHHLTGIDIHPGAQIGGGLAIDHGTGIVVGETAVIGDRVRIYHGVTLGNLSVEKHQQGAKRHPTIENDVILYANSTIIGGSTVVGHDSIIGGGVLVTKSVPPHSKLFLSRTSEKV